MPRLSHIGNALMGVGSGINSINGAVVPSLATAGGAGGDWLTDNIIITPTNLGLGDGLNLYQVIVSTDTRSVVAANGANFIKAGGGVYERLLFGSVLTNVVALPTLPGAGTGWVDWDGTWCVVTAYGTSSGITVYDEAGVLVQQVDAVLTGPVRLRDGWLAYATILGWVIVDGATGAALPNYVRLQNITNMIPMVAGSSVLVVEYDASVPQFTLRKATSSTGLVIAVASYTMFNVDAVVMSDGRVRVAWSTGAGELPNELVVLDIDTETGETEQAVVVGDALVWSTGPTLDGETFSVAGGAPIKVPYPDRLIDAHGQPSQPWQGFFNKLAKNVQTVMGQVQAIVPASATTGPVVDAEFLVATSSAALPLARVVQDSASVEWDFTTPGVASAAVVPEPPLADQFLVAAASALPGARLVQDSATVVWDFSIAGVATAETAGAGSGTSWIPMVDGSEPPNFITDGAGHLILVAYP